MNRSRDDLLACAGLSGTNDLHVAGVRAQVLLSLFSDFANCSVFELGPGREKSVNAMPTPNICVRVDNPLCFNGNGHAGC